MQIVLMTEFSKLSSFQNDQILVSNSCSSSKRKQKHCNDVIIEVTVVAMYLLIKLVVLIIGYSNDIFHINPLLPNVPQMGRLAKILILI